MGGVWITVDGGGGFKVPAVFRIAGGGSTRGAGCHHGQSLEATLMHHPGLKIVYPATPADAKGLLRSAIRDDLQHVRLALEAPAAGP